MFIVTSESHINCTVLICQWNIYFSDGPDNVVILGPTKLEVGQTLILICSAESTPTATYTWILNGRDILNNSAVFIKKKSESSDSGKYICQARNNLTGRISYGEHTLSVQGKVAAEVWICVYCG